MKVTYQDFLDDPSVLVRIREHAHRERAAAVRQLIFEPIKNLFSRHAARPRLARQGCA